MQTLDEQIALTVLFDAYAPEYSGFFYHNQVDSPANDYVTANSWGQ